MAQLKVGTQVGQAATGEMLNRGEVIGRILREEGISHYFGVQGAATSGQC